MAVSALLIRSFHPYAKKYEQCVLHIRAPWSLDKDDQTEAISIRDESCSHLNYSLGSIIASFALWDRRTLTLMTNSQTLHPTCRKQECIMQSPTCLRPSDRSQHAIRSRKPDSCCFRRKEALPVEFTLKGTSPWLRLFIRKQRGSRKQNLDLSPTTSQDLTRDSLPPYSHLSSLPSISISPFPPSTSSLSPTSFSLLPVYLSPPSYSIINFSLSLELYPLSRIWTEAK